MEHSITALRPHPENKKIYGDSPDADLTMSVKKKGILTPLLITRTALILSGHRRWNAAKAAGLSTVPVTLFKSNDELDILEALIESNRQRVKENEQIGREVDALLGIEQERAKRRQEEHAKTAPGKKKETLVKPVTQVKIQTRTPPSRDTVGKKVGVSGLTAGRAAFCIRVMDALDKIGKTVEAHQVRQQLRKNVSKAYRLAKDLETLTKPPAEKPLFTVPKQPKYLTLDYWQTLDEAEQHRIIATAPRNSREGINEQKTDYIEWAQWSWNPVVGCLHNCTYCYARDIAENLYPQKFAPAFTPSRLYAPRNIPVPDKAQTNIGFKNIFTCSMADLFGKWVPQAWIEAVLTVVRECPQWNFLFLTKFPLRLAEFAFPDNAWVGTSVDCQARVANAETAFRHVHASVKWLSCEPLLENITFSSLSMFQWVVIGGSSKSTQTPEFHPPRLWINNLWAQARDAGCKIYEKTNLLERLREYPGQREEVRPEDVTKEFHYALLSQEK